MKKNKIVLEYEKKFLREVREKWPEKEGQPLFNEDYISSKISKIQVKTKTKVEQINNDNLSKLKNDYFSFDNYLNEHEVKEGKVVEKAEQKTVKPEYSVSKWLAEIERRTKLEEEEEKERTKALQRAVISDKTVNKDKEKIQVNQKKEVKVKTQLPEIKLETEKNSDEVVVRPSQEQIVAQWEKIEQMRKSFKTPADNLIEELLKLKEESRAEFKFQLLVYLLLQNSSGTCYQIMVKLRNFGLNVHKISTLNDTQFEELGKSVGYPQGRMRHFRMLCKEIKEVYSANPPENFQLVLGLPGMSPNSAAMYMNFIEVEGHIAVTPNVQRVVERLRWIDTKNSVFAKKQLEDILPKEIWGKITHSLEGFGSVICTNSSPSCGACLLIDTCDARVNNRIFKDVLKKKEKHKKLGFIQGEGEPKTESEEDVKVTKQVKRRKTKND